MGGAGSLLAVNLALSICFAAGFFAIARFDSARPAPRWFALAFGFGALYAVGEAVIGTGTAPLLGHMMAALGFVLVLAASAIGLARHYGRAPQFAWIAAIVTLSVPLYLGLYFLPRELLARQIGYQLPYVVLQVLCIAIVLRAAPRAGALDKILAGILVAFVLTTVTKPLVAHLSGGVGARAEEYVSSLYATISQTTGGVLSLAVGVFMMLILAREIAQTLIARGDRDPDTGYFTPRGFEARLAVALEGRAGPQALMIVDISAGPARGPLQDATVAALLAALSARTAPWAAWARIGTSRYAVFDPAANVLTARRAMQTVLALAGEYDAVVAIGIAETEEGDVPRVIIRRCEGAVARALQTGGNCVRIAPRSQLAAPDRLVG